MTAAVSYVSVVCNEVYNKCLDTGAASLMLLFKNTQLISCLLLLVSESFFQAMCSITQG